jgi:glyoxylase-like metal-dependent hydrolase (beta-lactamase superfamily II)
MDYRVISIGTLSRNPFWKESAGLRTPHATTTLIRSGDKTILVDPALPPQVLAARLNERSGLRLEDITDVFLTNFRPAHRGGILGLTHARWWISEAERESIGPGLVHMLERDLDDDVRDKIKQDIAVLQRCKSAPDSLADNVDLFPLPGYTPGTCGLLLPLPTSTVLIASDAIATVEHLERGQVLSGGSNVDQAQESFREAVEIADWIIPGHDNVTPNLIRRGM